MFRMKDYLDLAMLPIDFHPAVSSHVEAWAMYCGVPSSKLCRSTEHQIRTRHHEAVKDDFSRYEQNGFPIDIFGLPVGSGLAHYSIEPTAIVVRGYSWKIIGEPLDNHDGGGFSIDSNWGWRHKESTPFQTRLRNDVQ